jgi:hypothetical protein
VVESGIPIICRFFASIGVCIGASDHEIITEITKTFAFKYRIVDVTAVLQMEDLMLIEHEYLCEFSRLFGYIVKGDLSSMPRAFIYGIVYLALDKLFSSNIPDTQWIGLPSNVPVTRFSYDNNTSKFVRYSSNNRNAQS